MKIRKIQKRLYIVLGVLALLFSVIALLLFWVYYRVPESASRKASIAFLDVGQGDAILIKTPFGQNILIDGGPDSSVIGKLEDELPWWDRTIDLAVLTHPHDDHVAGLIDVFKRYHVKKILYSGVVHDSPAYLEWLKLVRDQSVPLAIIDRPQKIIFGSDCFFDILYPRSSFLGLSVPNLNNSSLVAKFVCANDSVLFTGDAESEVEAELIEGGVDLHARILKTGHHGSDTSSSEKFIKAVSAEKAVISVGADNKFGHPSLRTLKRLERSDAEILRTDLSGTIRF